jgi:riboflavin kinase/FMN adenylyltransferase
VQIVYGAANLVDRLPNSVVTIGVFDGVHLGHRRLIQTAVQHARSAGQPCVVVTFDKHPASIVRPESVPPTLTPLHQKLAKFESLDVDIAFVLQFDSHLASLTAEQFFECVIRGSLGAALVVVGHDFRFGKDRTGDPKFLENRIATVTMPPFELQGARVSSSEVRKAVLQGELHSAHWLLAAPYAMAGVVVPGEKIGRTLGVPTANLRLIEDQLIPAHGIYAGIAHVGPKTFPCAISVGDRPSLDSAGFAIEAHLLDYSGGELYGRTIVLDFHEKIRGQSKFETMDALEAQMKSDIERTRALIRSQNE